MPICKACVTFEVWCQIITLTLSKCVCSIHSHPNCFFSRTAIQSCFLFSVFIWKVESETQERRFWLKWSELKSFFFFFPSHILKPQFRQVQQRKRQEQVESSVWLTTLGFSPERDTGKGKGRKTWKMEATELSRCKQTMTMKKKLLSLHHCIYGDT